MILLAQSVEGIGNSIEKWTQNNGLAVVLLFIAMVAGGYAAIKISRWLGNVIIIPLRDAAISYLQRSELYLQRSEATLTTVSTTLQDMGVSLREARGDQAKILQSQEDLRGKVEIFLREQKA